MLLLALTVTWQVVPAAAQEGKAATLGAGTENASSEVIVAVLPFTCEGDIQDVDEGYWCQALFLCVLDGVPCLSLLPGDRYARVSQTLRKPWNELGPSDLTAVAKALDVDIAIAGKVDGRAKAVTACLVRPQTVALAGEIVWTNPVPRAAGFQTDLAAAVLGLSGVRADAGPIVARARFIKESALAALGGALRAIDHAVSAAGANDAKSASEGYAAAMEQLAPIVSDLHALPLLTGAVEHICRAALAGRGDLIAPVFYLGLVHYVRGDHEQALGACNRALTMTQSEPQVFNLMGLAYEAKGDYMEARGAFEEALKVDGRFAIALYNLGRLFEQQGDPEGARSRYLRVIELDSSLQASALAHAALALPLLDSGGAEEALKHLKTAIKLDPTLAEAHYDHGVALSQLERMEEAAEAYQAAIKMQPAYAQAHNNLGVVLFDLGQISDAILEYSRALEADPHFFFAHRNLAVAHEKQGDFMAAQADWAAYLSAGDQVPAQDRTLARAHLMHAKRMCENDKR